MARKLITFDRLLPEKGITDSRSTLDRKEKANPPLFPRRVRTSSKRIAWFEHEIDAYIEGLQRGHAFVDREANRVAKQRS